LTFLKNKIALSTKDVLIPSKSEITSKKNLNSKNKIESLKNIPEINKNKQDLNQILESIEKNHVFSQNNTLENEDDAYKGFENRFFNNNDINIEDQFGNIFSANESFDSNIGENEEKKFEQKFPEDLILRTSVREKKISKYQN